MNTTNLEVVFLRRHGKMFEKIMNYIKDFSDKLEGFLIIHYDEMYREQPQATKILNEEVPDICAAAEPGMKSEEIEEFKQKLEIEYNKAFKALII